MVRLGTPLVYFKVAYTGNSKHYYVCPEWKMDDFFNIMKAHIIRDFAIEEFEIVEAGQNTPSGFAEEAPSLDRNDSKLLREKYGEHLDVSFYIRPILRVEECIVCFEQTQNINYYDCRHPLCVTCLNGCLENNIHCCPGCRCQIVRIS